MADAHLLSSQDKATQMYPILLELISPSNFAEVKAPHIKATLARIITECGEPNIDFLKDWPVEEGLRWPMSLPGDCLKTASLVLLFNFSKLIMPVDMHVHRVSLHSDLIPRGANAEKAHALLLALLPPDPPRASHRSRALR